MSTTTSRFVEMARSVKGNRWMDWPAWSKGEHLIVALLLNDAEALQSEGYTMLEALDRLDGEFSVKDLRAMERQV